MSNDDTGANVADTDVNSTDADGTNPPERDSAAVQGSGDDAERGNLDGSNAPDEPRDRSLDQAAGNGSFDQVSDQSSDSETSDTSDLGESGQDNGLND